MSDEKKYFHEISDEEVASLDDKKMDYVYEHYKQPDWCDYPEALNPMFGCWSLTGSNRKSISHDFCKTCELYKPIPNKQIEDKK